MATSPRNKQHSGQRSQSAQPQTKKSDEQVSLDAEQNVSKAVDITTPAQESAETFEKEDAADDSQTYEESGDNAGDESAEGEQGPSEQAPEQEEVSSDDDVDDDDVEETQVTAEVTEVTVTESQDVADDDVDVDDIRRLLSPIYGATNVRHWSDDEAISVHRAGYIPDHVKKTARGNWPNDPARAALKASEWRRSEILDWIEGAISPTQCATHEMLREEAMRISGAPMGMPWEDVTILLTEAGNIPISSRGNLLRDLSRISKVGSQLTLTELSDIVMDELDNHLPEKDLMAALRERIWLFDSTSTGSRHGASTDDLSDEEIIDLVKQSRYVTQGVIPMQVNQLLGTLQTYRETMGPGRSPNQNDAAACQMALFQAVKTAFSRQNISVAFEELNTIFDFAHAHGRTMFSPTNAYRGVTALRMTASERARFDVTWGLLMKVSDPAVRRRAKGAVNWDMVFSAFQDEKSISVIRAFFGLED